MGDRYERSSYPPPGQGGPPPYNYGPPGGQQGGYGGPPPSDYSRFQPGPGANRSPPRGGGGGYGGPPPRGGPPPPRSGYGGPADQGWGSRQRRRSASPGDRGPPPERGDYGRERAPYGGPPPGAAPYRGGPDYGRGPPRSEPSTLDPGRGRRRIPREEGDTGLTEEEHASIVEERKRKEQPCRTLFIRNVKYGVTADQVRERFERIGDIKTCFDMLEKRGMLFITYYDIRAAILAKEQLQRSMINGRPIDVHFSLPRDADLAKRCDREKGQGALSLDVIGARGPIDDRELNDRFGEFGELYSVAANPDRPAQRIIQYFDSRGTEKAFDRLNDQPLAGGRMELRFMWDPPPSLLPRMPAVAPRDYGYGTNRPGMAPTPGYGTAGGYGAPAAGGFGGAPAGGAPIDSQDRLQQALRVQQMLATLGGSAPPAATPAAAPAPYGGAPPPPAPYSGAGPSPYQQPPHLAGPPSAGGYGPLSTYGGALPAPYSGGYNAGPPSAAGAAATPPQPAQPALPPALLALLEKTRGSSGYSPQGASGGGTPPYAGSAPPPAPVSASAPAGEAPPPQVADPAKVQQLLAMLAQQQPK